MCIVMSLFVTNVGYNYIYTTNGKFNDLLFIFSHKIIFSSIEFLELCDSRFYITIWLSTMQPNLMSMVKYLLRERSGMIERVCVECR